MKDKNAAGTPTVLLCAGGDCGKERKARARIVDALDGHARVRDVRCQKICDGPVVGLEVDGQLEWFEEVDSGKARRALVTWADEGRLKRPLKKRRVKKRAGKQR
jgi:hypothetical protein